MEVRDLASFRWLASGRDAFAAMQQSIAAATKSILLETYICSDGVIARDVRDALVAACRRGVEVQVLIDAFGSIELKSSFWDPLVEVGGQFRWFNPLALDRFACRNHRKLLVCDREVAFVGGYNLSDEYNGDGVGQGWRDLGLELRGDIVPELAESFVFMFGQAGVRHDLWQRIRPLSRDPVSAGRNWKLLLNIPSFRRHAIKRTLVEDLAQAKSIRMIAAYFLPTWRIRSTLMRRARFGARVQLILAGKSDVRLAQLASHRLYEMLLRAGVEVYEYQPQVLHAKLVIIDNAVFGGSCNMDLRSLNVNYELMVRVSDSKLADEAHALFEADLVHCRRITTAEWRAKRGWWTRVQESLAYFLLARLDPFIARWRMRSLR